MVEALRVNESLWVPPGAISVKRVRSSGPGGQNVNKVSSKVELRVDPEKIPMLREAARSRLRRLAPSCDANGCILIVRQGSRSQHENLASAIRALQALIERSLRPPRPRIGTHPSTSSRERRLDRKHREATRKNSRRKVSGEE